MPNHNNPCEFEPQTVATPNERQIAPLYEYEATQYFEDGYVQLWPNSYVINGQEHNLKLVSHQNAYMMLKILLDHVGKPVSRAEIIIGSDFYSGYSQQTRVKYAVNGVAVLKQQFTGTGMFHYGVYSNRALQGIGVIPEDFEQYDPRTGMRKILGKESLSSELVESEQAIFEPSYNEAKWEPYLHLPLTRKELEVMGYLYNQKSNVVELSDIAENAAAIILSTKIIENIINSINQKASSKGVGSELQISPEITNGEHRRYVVIKHFYN